MGDGDHAGVMLPAAVDVEGLRALARRAADLAEQVADAAARARTVAGVDWRSVAAERLRSDLDACTRQADRCSEALGEVAAALLRHAAAVDQRAAVLRAAVEAAGAVGGPVAQLARGVVDR